MRALRNTLILMFLAGAALAQAESDKPNFIQLDADGDGRLSKTEAKADTRVAKRFDEADTDRDGYLTLQEFSAIWQ